MHWSWLVTTQAAQSASTRYTIQYAFWFSPACGYSKCNHAAIINAKGLRIMEAREECERNMADASWIRYMEVHISTVRYGF